MGLSPSTKTSLWEAFHAAPGKAVASAVSRCDVCIVGAGIAGLTTGYLLAREGRKVLILEYRAIGSGQTGKTSAHLSSALDDRFAALERSRGGEAARIAAESHAGAIDRIEAIAREEKIDCDFARVDGYLFAATKKDAELIDKELEAAHRAGLSDVEKLERLPIPGVVRGPRFPRQARFEPLRYLDGLAVAFRRLGGEIATGRKVEEIGDDDPITVTTAGGAKVVADSVVIAANTPFNDRYAIHTKQAPYQSYALAAPIPRDALPDALYWDTLDPYHYVRMAEEDGRMYLVVGGEDHKTGQADDADERFARLESWGRALVPAMGPAAYRWSGQVHETIDGLGFIGRNPLDASNVYVATGDSGMGLTHGTIAGVLITDLIQGRGNPWTKAYDPSRKPLGGLGDFVRENTNVAFQYLDWITRGDVGDPSAIPPGSGAVIRQGVSKLAVYRDEQGEVHAKSAVCPHLDCIVAWNQASSTWDCPCHGSQFDCRGKVVQGPAVSDLKPAKLG